MRHHVVYTVLFPIRLLFVGVCLVFRLARVGLTLNGVLKFGCVGCPIVGGLVDFGYA